jgi:hypothetical protein
VTWLFNLLTGLPGFLNGLLAYLNKKQDTAAIFNTNSKDVAVATLAAESVRTTATKEVLTVAMSHPIWWVAWGLGVFPVWATTRASSGSPRSPSGAGRSSRSPQTLRTSHTGCRLDVRHWWRVVGRRWNSSSMEQESLMEHLTTAGAGAAITSPLWLQTVNPYLQFAVACLGGLWLITQIVTKLYTTFFKKEA